MTDAGIVIGGVLLSALAIFGPSFKTTKKEKYADFESENVHTKKGAPRGHYPENPGSQSSAYNQYQQAVNASIPTANQLSSISGQVDKKRRRKGNPQEAEMDNMIGDKYHAVNVGSNRAQNISACAQNVPSFVSSSLLPKPEPPGKNAWHTNAPNNVLANQNFLSAAQQYGVDTTLGSTRYQSYDLRNSVYNPINVVSPWNNTWIMPDLERRPLECNLPDDGGMYSCGNPS